VPRFVDLVNPDLTLIIPQLIILGMALLLLVADVALPKARHGLLTWMALAGLGAALVANFFYIGMNEATFNGAFRADDISVFVNLVVLVAGILSVVVSSSYVQNMEEPGSMPLAEYYVLLLFSVLGAMLVGSAGDLVMVFLGIEMTALASYALTGFARRRLTSLEGALKYFLLGLFASAILVYGMAWIYGATGSTSLDGIAESLAGTVGDDPLEASLLLAILLLVIGLAFKVAAVPFHMWTPDAYEGAPTPVSAYMSVIPKVAGFAAMIRILVQALEPVRNEWIILVGVLAVITMAFGNIVAITQRSVKRMLAYSSIGHTGYILAGFAAFSVAELADELAISSVLYYLFAYTFMNIGAFGIVTWLQHRGRGVNIENFNGLASQSPLMAVAMTIFMLSLMGLPPLVGFYAKYYVILAAVEADMLWLAIAIVLASAASAFFYLRVVAAMYFAEATEVVPEGRTQMLGFGVAVMVVGTIFAGIFSGQLLELAQNWVRSIGIMT
jgi:NADH-quinone oxidoreductase subunit N